MENFEKTPLASVSDGNLIEKYVDWKESFLARWKKWRFDKMSRGKEIIDEFTRVDKSLLISDATVGLNAEQKQAMVNLMHQYESLLSRFSQVIAAKQGNKDDAADVVALTARAVSSDVTDDSKEPKDSKKLDDEENSKSASNSLNEATCRRCGLFCANYKKCPALLKQCRKCGRMDHYEKMCNEVPIVSISDVDLVDKWFDWKRSFMSRMKQYHFDKTPGGKQIIESTMSAGTDILTTDREIGLNAERKIELVRRVYSMEYNLSKIIAKRKSKEDEIADGNCEVNYSFDDSTDSSDVEEAFQRYLQEQDELADGVFESNASPDDSIDSSNVEEVSRKLDCLTTKSPLPESKEICLRCGLCCGNYNRCPALGKQCRRCFRIDHYEKTCTSEISSAENEYIYDPLELFYFVTGEKQETPKNTIMPSVKDVNFVEKWFDWKQTVRFRMREYNFDSTSKGKEAIEFLNDITKEITKEDRQCGLRRKRKEEILNLMCKFERILLDNIARVKGVDFPADSAGSTPDIPENPKESEVANENSAFSTSLCWRCGFFCKNYKQCPADDKKCRRCQGYDHFAIMCGWKRSRHELRDARGLRRIQLLPAKLRNDEPQSKYTLLQELKEGIEDCIEKCKMNWIKRL